MEKFDIITGTRKEVVKALNNLRIEYDVWIEELTMNFWGRYAVILEKIKKNETEESELESNLRRIHEGDSKGETKSDLWHKAEHAVMGQKMWADFKSDFERIEFLKSGEAVNTGIVAPSLVEELIKVFTFRRETENRKKMLERMEKARRESLNSAPLYKEGDI